jgi:uncharacterized protein YggT (Ycf19 family)
MQEPDTRVEQTTVRAGNTTQTTQEVARPVHDDGHRSVVVSRVIWFIAGVILVLLAFRFVFVLLGANESNGFANFIYSVSYPLASPFFGLFGYSLKYGVSRVEVSTLVAAAVYAIVAYGIAKLATITRD